MTVDEIIAKINEALQDDSIVPVLSDVNGAVNFIAAQSYLPSLVTQGAAKFNSVSAIVADATNAEPIVLTASVAHGLNTGDIVVVDEVVGNTAANGTWYIEVLTDTTLSLLTSDGNGAYVSGGALIKRDAYVDMPTDFSHDLFEAFSISQNVELNVRSNLKAMSALHSADERLNSDVIEDVTVENGLLYGMPVGQSDDIIMCKYYCKPTQMTLTSESPVCIPEHLHESIIVQYILSLKWPLIEDGLDGNTSNTDRAIAMFGGGMAALMQYYPRPSIAQPIIVRHFHYF